jgi:hypothetical protein
LSARRYGIGLPLLALVVSFAAVLGLGSRVAVRAEPEKAGSTGRPVAVIVRPGQLDGNRVELVPGVTVWRDSSIPGQEAGTEQVCIELPQDWVVEGPGWERGETDGKLHYCLRLEREPPDAVEVPVVRHP